MFDVNQFKRGVKEWIRVNPHGSELDLRDFCDEIIPPPLYQANQWLIEQTLSWYRHILERRENDTSDDYEGSEA